MRGIKTDLVRGEEEWQKWDLSRLVQALKKWEDINPVEDGDLSQKSKRYDRKSEFFHAKENEHRKRACVYCDKDNHISIAQGRPLLMSVRNVLHRRSCVSTVRVVGIVLLRVKVAQPVKIASSSTIPPFVISRICTLRQLKITKAVWYILSC